MTSAVRSPSPSLGERIAQARRTLFRTGDLTTILLVIALVVLPALALAAADWPLDMVIILPVAVLSTVIGFLLARSAYNELFALILSGGYATATTFLSASFTTPGGGPEVITRLIAWLTDAVGGGINQDPLVFSLLVAVLFWFLGYNAAWHVFRIDRVWRVILPPGALIITNSVFYTGGASLEPYLFGFLFVALVLIAHSSLDEREWDWYTHGVRVPKRLRHQFMRVGAVLALVTVLLAWAMPTQNIQERLDEFQEFMRSDPMRELSEVWNRLFASVEAEGPTSADYFGGDALNLSGAVTLGDQEVLLVEAPPDQRYYWRSRVFDTYELGQWTSGATIRLTTPQAPYDIPLEADRARMPVEQRFTIGVRSTRLVYAAPQIARVDVPARTYMSYIYQNVDNSPMNVSAVRPLQPLTRGDQYTALSLMSVATAEELNAAGTAYPDWITNHPQYLRSSPNVMGDRTRALAAQIVADANATTPYDKAKAIERWLRINMSYNESIPSPPPGRDPIEWFLFDLQQGYCNYYATAMIVMLRAQGIPARMAAGFAQGTFDDALGQYVVRERDAHTWVEAYFPGYGWIEFEPTAAQAPLMRDGDDEIPAVGDAMAQQVTPTPSPTPTEEPTITPSPTLDAMTPTAQPPDSQPPTITPTPTPSPTPTPVIIPTSPPPIEPRPRDPLSMLLPALGAFLLLIVIVLVLFLLGVFIYWWWEWRGMRGLSPLTRAYKRLERYLGLIGLRFAPQETPEERRRRITRAVPGAERPVTYITRGYAAERYGPPITPDEEDERAGVAGEAWGAARKSILGRWLRRLRFWKRD
jgi:transglutaminase-like putative cysteine protease